MSWVREKGTPPARTRDVLARSFVGAGMSVRSASLLLKCNPETVNRALRTSVYELRIQQARGDMRDVADVDEDLRRYGVVFNEAENER